VKGGTALGQAQGLPQPLPYLALARGCAACQRPSSASGSTCGVTQEEGMDLRGRTGGWEGGDARAPLPRMETPPRFHPSAQVRLLGGSRAQLQPCTSEAAVHNCNRALLQLLASRHRRAPPHWEAHASRGHRVLALLPLSLSDDDQVLLAKKKEERGGAGADPGLQPTGAAGAGLVLLPPLLYGRPWTVNTRIACSHPPTCTRRLPPRVLLCPTCAESKRHTHSRKHTHTGIHTHTGKHTLPTCTSRLATSSGLGHVPRSQASPLAVLRRPADSVKRSG